MPSGLHRTYGAHHLHFNYELVAGALLRLQCLERQEASVEARYMHRNPVKRGLVESPELWPRSNYRHYLLDEAAPVQINVGWAEISFRNGAA